MQRLVPLTLLASLLAAAAHAAPRQETATVAGLSQPAEIRIDRWGIAHIYAADRRVAFFLQGYNVARDRLWQVDLWRKRGLGLLARDFGPDYVAQDRAARLFLYRGDMEKEWAAYGAGARDNTEAFVAGINAYIDRCEADRALLPPEFSVMKVHPGRWSPKADVPLWPIEMPGKAGSPAPMPLNSGDAMCTM